MYRGGSKTDIADRRIWQSRAVYSSAFPILIAVVHRAGDGAAAGTIGSTASRL